MYIIDEYITKQIYDNNDIVNNKILLSNILYYSNMDIESEDELDEELEEELEEEMNEVIDETSMMDKRIKK